MLQRRSLLAAIVPLVFLAGCVGDTPDARFAQAKAYLAAGAAAVTAAAQQYLAGPPKPSDAQAQAIAQALQGLQTVVDSTNALAVPTDWKMGAVQALAYLHTLTPLVSKQLGASAPYVDLAISVVNAFVLSLPPVTPDPPPAPLVAKAAQKT